MGSRYFVEGPIQGQGASLSGSEAHHLVHVMRAKVGDSIVLFDGSGAEFTARVSSIARQAVTCEILERKSVDRELSRRIVLGVALPKADRQRYLVEKSVELGVARVVPLQASRAVAKPTSSAISRLRRAVIEASKQCGRNRLMEIGEPCELAQFLDAAPPESCRWLADPSGSPPPAPPEDSCPHYVCIGPEGGFSDEELWHAQQSGWTVVALGPRILRVETAALQLAAVIAWCG